MMNFGWFWPQVFVVRGQGTVVTGTGRRVQLKITNECGKERQDDISMLEYSSVLVYVVIRSCFFLLLFFSSWSSSAERKLLYNADDRVSPPESHSQSMNLPPRFHSHSYVILWV